MKIFVTGASGFLGAEICRQLSNEGHRVVANGRDLRRLGSVVCETQTPGDLLEMNLAAALEDIEMVIHSAALSSPWGHAKDFEAANVTATKRLLEAAKRGGARRFIHISTPAVYYDETDRLNLTEASPLSTRPANDYVRTKLESERLVLSSMPAIVLRPRAIFGPGDRTLFPRLANAARAGRLRIFGTGETVCDLTVVTNAAYAAVCAVRAGEAAIGNVYNITNGDPVVLWHVIDEILTRCGYQPPARKISKPVALALASAVEFCTRILGGREPWITRYSAGLLMCSQTFDIARARNELGYEPRVSVQQGIQEFVEWYRKNES